MPVEPSTVEVEGQPGVAGAARNFPAARADSRLRKELRHPLEVRQQNERAIPAHRGAQHRSEGVRALQGGALALQEGALALREGAERCSWQCPSPGLALPAGTTTCSEERRLSHFMQFILFLLSFNKINLFAVTDD